MELSADLKTIEPLKGAFDILRYFRRIASPTADADDIMDDLDLSERAFGKAMRRLVTKGYTVMDGDMIYRLTDKGHDASEEIEAYDAAGGKDANASARAKTQVARRLVVAVPSQIAAQQPAAVHVGFHPADGAAMSDSVELVVRTSVVNGQSGNPEDLLFSLQNDHAAQGFQVAAADSSPLRLRFEVYQLGEMGDIEDAGGMYVDVPVVTGSAGQMTAYGADVTLTL